MPTGSPAPIGTCQKCGNTGEKLYASGIFEGLRCKRCWKQAKNANYAGKAVPASTPLKPASGPRIAAPVAAPKAPAPPPTVKQRPATPLPALAPAVFSPLTGRSLAEALQVEEVRLLVTCRTTAAVLAVVRAVESDGDVMIGVDAAARQG